MDSLFNYLDGSYSSFPSNSNAAYGQSGHTQGADASSQGAAGQPSTGPAYPPQGYDPAGHPQYAMYNPQYQSSHGDMAGYPMRSSRGGGPYGASAEMNAGAASSYGSYGDAHPSYYGPSSSQMYRAPPSSTSGGYPLRPQSGPHAMEGGRSAQPTSQSYASYSLNQPGYPPMGNSNAFPHSANYMNRAPYGTLRSSGESASYGSLPLAYPDATGAPSAREGRMPSHMGNPSRGPGPVGPSTYVHPAHAAPPPGRSAAPPSLPSRIASPKANASAPPSRGPVDARGPDTAAMVAPPPGNRPTNGSKGNVTPSSNGPTGAAGGTMSPPKKEENIEEFKIKAQSMKKQYLNRLEGMIKNMEDIKPSARSEDTKHKYDEIQKKLTLLRTLITADFKPNSNFPPRKEILEAAEKQIIMWINQWEKLERRGASGEEASIDPDSLDAMINQRFPSTTHDPASAHPTQDNAPAGVGDAADPALAGFEPSDPDFNLLFSDEFDFGDTLNTGYPPAYASQPPDQSGAPAGMGYPGGAGHGQEYNMTANVNGGAAGASMGVNPSQLHRGGTAPNFGQGGYGGPDEYGTAMDPSQEAWGLGDEFSSSLGYKRSRGDLQDRSTPQGPPSKRDRLS